MKVQPEACTGERSSSLAARNPLLACSLLLVVIFGHILDAAAEKIQEIKDRIEKKYGVQPKRWDGWADEPKEESIRTVFQAVSRQVGVPSSYIYTVAIGEGMNLWLDGVLTNGVYDLKKEVDGYAYAGLDHFSSDFERVKSYLPANYKKSEDFREHATQNEQGTSVKSAVFTSFSSAMYGLGAIIRHRQELVKTDATALNLKLDEDNLFYWTYAYFVDGEADGRRDLEKTRGVYRESTRNAVKARCIDRLATWRYLQARELSLD